MRLKVSKSKNSASFYVIKSVYNPKTKSNTSVVVERLGTEKKLREELGENIDPYEWAKGYVEKLNEEEKRQNRTVLIPYKQSKTITKNQKRLFNGGYLFLQSLYNSLGLKNICDDISNEFGFKYDLNSILSRLIYGRIIYPSSKLNTFEESKKFLEQPNFDLHQIYRALDKIAKKNDFIQSEVYKNSKKISTRNDSILFYDCTNFFFECEEESGIRKYGPSKEHRPNPIVQMGLFMDGSGIPLAFSLQSGNTNEQKTMIPLEKNIIKDFEHSSFIVCTDAGLSSKENKMFNSLANRSYITTLSTKKIKKHLLDWCLDPNGWHLSGSKKIYNLDEIQSSDENIDKYKGCTFYKERWVNENGFEEKYVITFSLKYKLYQRKIRNRQVEKAHKLVNTSPSAIKKSRANDYKRFIKKSSYTPDGELAEFENYFIDEKVIFDESIHDGFYLSSTNLDEDGEKIAAINHSRWEIEECFRIMKSDFESRPVFLQRDDRIQAHFITCFLSLIIMRLLEQKLDYKYTICDILDTLRNMNFLHASSEGYIPVYERTDITDDLHEAFGFRTDYEIVSDKNMKKIFKETTKKKKVREI
ncbi:IS1634 family transposase [Peptostreptococcus anaerobius]